MSGNGNHLTDILQKNFLEYASYVIKERALPNLEDGLKPVQRRILYSLWEMDDGRFNKVANVIGHCMKYHPHGDASIGDALIVLANKGFFIERQGNFGNILTGDAASAPRYIECRLTELAREVLLNKEITDHVPSYDGRNKEPVLLPCKIPYLLLQGAEGIAVGMSTRILPHNFNEVLEAQIKYLNGKSFKLYPDFLQGGLIDISEYNDGYGKIRVRAKIDFSGAKTLNIHEVPFGVTSENLIASIEDAIRKNRVKVSSINDFTTENVNIELSMQRGVYAEEVAKRLYAYTDCEISVSSNITLIENEFPKNLSISDILKKCTDNLTKILKRELTLKLENLEILHIRKSLEQIFIEKKIYRGLENCKTQEKINETVEKGLKPYVRKIGKGRRIVLDDIERLLQIPIRKISRFDLDKSNQELKDIRQKIKTTQGHLLGLKRYTISLIKGLLKKYGSLYPRRSKIIDFEVVNAKDLKDTDTKVFYDTKTGYIGTRVRGDQKVDCSSFDKILIIGKNGAYKVVPVPEKLFCDQLVFFGIADKTKIFNSVVRDRKNKNCYIKRFIVDKFIQNKDYKFFDESFKLEKFTPCQNPSLGVEYKVRVKGKPTSEVFDFKDFQVKPPGSRGTRVGSRQIKRMRLSNLTVSEEEGSSENLEQS